MTPLGFLLAFALGATAPIAWLYLLVVRFATRRFARARNTCEVCGRGGDVLDMRAQISALGRPSRLRTHVYCEACAGYFAVVLPPEPRWTRQDGEPVA